MRWTVPAAVAAIGLCAAAAEAEEAPAAIGTLTCTSLPSRSEGGGGSGIDAAALSCAFKAATGGHEERYSGTIGESARRLSLDARMVFVWTVLAPKDTRLAPGLLAQQYVAGTRGAAAPSPGPQVLVGQSNREIMLQQVSTAPTAGDTAIASMSLKLSATPA